MQIKGMSPFHFSMNRLWCNDLLLRPTAAWICTRTFKHSSWCQFDSRSWAFVEGTLITADPLLVNSQLVADWDDDEFVTFFSEISEKS